MQPGNPASEGDVDPLVGKVVAGRFRVSNRIGRGAMGAVYRAEQIAMGRQVALKLMRNEIASDAQMVRRFHREAKAACRVESPHVVTLFDFGESDGLLFIAMELLDGESLGQRLERNPRLPPAEAVRIARSIAIGLEAAHEAGVVHRDLKPDNVLLTRRGGLKVLDFGIAKMLEESGTAEDGPLTHVGMIVGTPIYMSPEAAGRKTVGPPADVYALGVMLFEMLVGRPPFMDETVVLLLGKHLAAPAELLRRALPGLDVPDELEHLVDELLAKQPEARPDAKTVALRLARIAEAGLAEDLGPPATAAADTERPPPPSRPSAESAQTAVKPRRVDDTPTTLVAAPTPAPTPTPTPAMISAPTTGRASPLVLGAAGLAVVVLVVLIAALVFPGYLRTPHDRASAPTRTPETTPPSAPNTRVAERPAPAPPTPASAPPVAPPPPTQQAGADSPSVDVAAPAPTTSATDRRDPRRATRARTPTSATDRPAQPAVPAATPTPPRPPQRPRIDSAEDIFGPSSP